MNKRGGFFPYQKMQTNNYKRNCVIRKPPFHGNNHPNN